MKKDRQYTEMQLAFLAALSDPKNKGNLRTCMNLAGYSTNLSTGHIVSSLSEEITEIANKMIASHAVVAAAGIIGVVTGEESLNAKHILNASKEILDRAGVVKKQSEELNIKVGSGLVILHAKQMEVEEEVEYVEDYEDVQYEYEEVEGVEGDQE